MTSVCADQERLTRAYNAFLADYLRSIQVLEQLAGSMRKDEYKAVSQGADQALQRLKQARAHLNEHIARHHCGGQTGAAASS